MNVTVKGRGVEVTPGMRDFAQRKIDKLSDFDSELRSADVTCKMERNEFKVEVMLHGDGLRIRAEERQPDYYQAVDLVLEKLEQQVKKHHRRQIARTRNHSVRQVPAGFAAALSPDLQDFAEPSPATQASELAAGNEQENGLPRITRVKRFAMKPMSPDDAAIEMEMLGHEFFVFRNTNSDVNVVYHRHDGTVGLIEVGE